MRNWTTKDARCVIDWARQPLHERAPIEQLADELGRSPEAVRCFVRRVLPSGQRPWLEKRRWKPSEIEAVRTEGCVPGRSAAAVKKFVQRHCVQDTNIALDENAETASLTVTQVASDLGLSRAAVYRLAKAGILRRFKGGIAETSFNNLLRHHPEVIPYCRLPREHKE